MAAPGHGQYAHAGPSTITNGYGAPLQSYAQQAPSACAPPYSGAGAGFRLEQRQAPLEWQPQQTSAPMVGGWMNGYPHSAMGDTGGSAPAAGHAPAHEFPPMGAHAGMHSAPAAQYDWQPQPRAYTPYHLPPRSAPHSGMYGYRPDAYPAYPQQGPPAPHTYQPLLLHSPPAAAPAHEQDAAHAFHPPPPPSSLPSVPVQLSHDSYARHASVSTTDATHDGSGAVSSPPLRESISPRDPPALVEPPSPHTQAANGSIELPPQMGAPSLVPSLEHVMSADVGPGRAAALPPDVEPGASSGTGRGTSDARAGTTGKRKKEPKDLASRKYACNECEQRFARPSALATHVLTHTKEKPFVCCTCNRGFAVMSNLRRHCRVRSHVLAPEQESSTRPGPRSLESSRSSGSSGASGTIAPDPPPPLRSLAPAPPHAQAEQY